MLIESRLTNLFEEEEGMDKTEFVTQKMPSLLTSTVTLPDTSPGTTQSIWDVERHTAATGNPSPNLHDNSRDATKPEPRTVKRKPPSPDATLGNVFRTDGRG